MKQANTPPPYKKQPAKPAKKREPIFDIVLLLCAALLLSVLHYRALNAPLDEGGATTSVAAQQSSTSLPAASANATLPEPEPESEPEPVVNRVRFSAVGDNLIHNGIYLQAQERAGGSGYDFNYVYENVSYFFEQFDVNWINQETLVTDELPPSHYPMFSTPGELGRAAYDAGWRVFALSNNHTYDKGAEGIAATRRYWSKMPEDTITTGIYTDAAADDAIALQEVNGIKLAYVAFTEHTNGLPTPEGAEASVVYTNESDKMEQMVRRARELADAVVVCVHWEVENSHDTTDAQRQLAADFANWGADVIIGTHPHVIQGVDWVEAEDGRRVPVAYSLGNFLSAQSQPNQLIGLCFTFELEQTVEPDGTKTPVTVHEVKVYPTVTHYDSNYKNIRCYMFRDYTGELAAGHGVRERFPGFTTEYIRDVLTTYVSPEYLVFE